MAFRLRSLIGFGAATTVLALAMPMAFGGQVGVSVIDVNSGLNPATEFNNIGPDVAVAVPAVSWHPNGTTPDGSPYEWISYNANTGINCASMGDCVANTTVNGSPSAIFTQTFNLPDPYNAGVINIWADDSASVYLNGNLVYTANPVLGPNCAATAIGCIPDAYGQVFVASDCGALAHCVDVVAGMQTLTIDVYQLGSASFGVQYEGEIMSEMVPEPATYALLGLGLTGLIFASKRLKRRA